MAGRVRNLSGGIVRLPADIVVDSSLLVVRFLAPFMPQQAATDAARAQWFFTELASGRTLGFVTPTAMAEILHLLIRAKFEADISNYAHELERCYGQRPNSRYRWTDLYKIRPGLLQRYANDLRAVAGQMINFGLYLVQPWDVGDIGGTAWEDELVRRVDRYQVDVNDATIFLDAERAGVKNVASLDRDHRRAQKDFDIYTWL